jgi:protein FRA10AC1
MKLFKEYCLADLKFYKEKKVGLRWRIEKEVIEGKGEDSCGSLSCSSTENLNTMEVNFAYVENNESKNALVKLKLCTKCKKKLDKANNVYEKKRKNLEEDEDKVIKKIKN